MTKFEVEEYLSKIYNVQVINVNTELKLGLSGLLLPIRIF
jgi:ribosomal protein L23